MRADRLPIAIGLVVLLTCGFVASGGSPLADTRHDGFITSEVDLSVHLEQRHVRLTRFYRAVHRRDWAGAAAAAMKADRQRVDVEPPAAPGRIQPPPAPPAGAWGRLAQCESGGNWANTDGSFEGGLQFANGTWLAYGGGSYAQHAYDAAPGQQIAVAEKVLAAAGGRYTDWPGCRAHLGLR